MTTHELLVSNLLGWVLILYPTEALRPRWLTLKKAIWQLLPIFVFVAIDYALSLNIAPVSMLYPFVLLALLITHMRAYRIWCEENFSTLDDIDVQWIMRYFIMIMLIAIVFLYMCLTLFTFIYGTEQILFRHDPWEIVKQLEKSNPNMNENSPMESGQSASSTDSNAAFRATLEQWMQSKKPYLNPDFRLLDLGQVLPLNRTYLSHFIHSEYDCTFYQFVNRYRIEEAKRMKMENPEMKIWERPVFSS